MRVLRNTLTVLLVLVLVAMLAPPAAADFGGEGDPPLPVTPAPAVQSSGSDQPLAWLVFAVIAYVVFFVPAPPLLVKCWPVGGYIICRPG